MDNLLPGVLETLHETARETFEILAFSEMSCWEIASTGPDSNDSWIGAAIDIHQPFSCRFSLLLNRKQCRQFVETAYGPEISDVPAIDCIFADYMGELANTIAGRLAAAFAQPDGKIVVGLPQPCGTPSADEKQTAVSFLLEDTAAWCFLEM